MARSAVDLEVAGRIVTVSSPDRLIYPDLGVTKLGLIQYYLAVGDPLLAALGGRPAMLERFPRGADGSSFFQKRVPANAPEWLTTATVSTPNGTESNALVIADLAHVVWAINLGCLGFHVWPSLATSIDEVDELRIDLDPAPGQPFDAIREAAHLARALLEELELPGGIKTSGNRGVHIYVRVEPADAITVRAAAVAFARELERRHPDRITSSWWKEERGDRVFIDFNQNAPHKTVFGAWCARGRTPGLVSTPFSWSELDAVDPNDFTVLSVPPLVNAAGDPWASRPTCSLEPLLELHRRDRAAGLLDAPWPPVYPKMPDEPPRVAPSRARRPPATP